MLEKDKPIMDEMMQFFGASSVEEVAVLLGYSPKTASTWHTKGLTRAAINKYLLQKAHTGQNTINGNTGAVVLGEGNAVVQNGCTLEGELGEVVALMKLYASPAMLQKFKEQLLKAKRLAEEIG